MTSHLSPDKVIELNRQLAMFRGGTARIMLYTCSHGKLIIQIKSASGDEKYIRCYWMKRICCQHEWKIGELQIEQQPDRVRLYDEEQSTVAESDTVEILSEYDFVKEFRATKIDL